MKDLLNTIFTTSKERISNPIIGTFIISWIAFNWKPILFMITSNKTIEERITYVDSNFSNIHNLLLFPLFAVVIYVLLIPYFNLLFEYLLEFSRIKRNIITISKKKQLIENKKQLAIEEIKLEEAQTEFKERKNQNTLIEDLHNTIKDKEAQLQLERERSNDLNYKIKEESSFLNKRFQQDRKEFEEKMNSLMVENEVLRQNMHQLEQNFNLNRSFHDNENIYTKDESIYHVKKNGQKIRIETLNEVEKEMLRNKGII